MGESRSGVIGGLLAMVAGVLEYQVGDKYWNCGFGVWLLVPRSVYAMLDPYTSYE